MEADRDPGRFVEVLLQTAFSLGGAYVSLLEDVPGDALPGEDVAAVVVEMFAASARSALDAAGEDEYRAAIALVVAVRQRILEDLRLAACLAATGE